MAGKREKSNKETIEVDLSLRSLLLNTKEQMFKEHCKRKELYFMAKEKEFLLREEELKKAFISQQIHFSQLELAQKETENRLLEKEDLLLKKEIELKDLEKKLIMKNRKQNCRGRVNDPKCYSDNTLSHEMMQNTFREIGMEDRSTQLPEDTLSLSDPLPRAEKKKRRNTMFVDNEQDEWETFFNIMKSDSRVKKMLKNPNPINYQHYENKNVQYQLVDLETKFVNKVKIGVAGRYLLKSGDVEIRMNGIKYPDAALFLFNDSVLFAKKIKQTEKKVKGKKKKKKKRESERGGQEYVSLEFIPLNHLLLNSSTLPHSFELRTTNTKNKIDVSCPNPDLLHSWVDSISNCILASN